MKRKLIISFILIISVIISACTPSAFSDSEENDSQLKVLTSVYPIYDFASKIGGEHIEVILLVPSGFEPHSWEPSTRDMLLFEDADIFIYNGAGMEMWVDKILDTVQDDNLVIVDTSTHVPLMEPGTYSMTEPHEWSEHNYHEHDCDDKQEHDHHDHEHDCDDKQEHDHHDHDHGIYDPHIWLDPQNANLQMDAICQAFIQADPDNAEYYTENLRHYSERIDALDQEYAERLSPYYGQFIVVSHEAFGYLCRAYGLYQIPIRGISADAEPDAARMREIIDFIRYYDINVVFFESLTDPKLADTIAAETGAEVSALHPIGGLTAEEAAAGEDYFSLMESNLEVIEYALSLD